VRARHRSDLAVEFMGLVHILQTTASGAVMRVNRSEVLRELSLFIIIILRKV